MVKPTEFYEIVDFEFRSAFLNVAVSLLRFVDYFRNFFLREVMILAQVFHSDSIIHHKLLTNNLHKSLTYSNIEY